MLSTGIRSLIALQILGDDSEALERFAEAAEKVIQPTPGAADVQMQREGGKPYAEIRLDPARLARFGLTNEQVMQAVETALGGMALTYLGRGRAALSRAHPLSARAPRRCRRTAQLQVAGRRWATAPSRWPACSPRPTVYTLDFAGAPPMRRRARPTAAEADQRNFTVLDRRAAPN